MAGMTNEVVDGVIAALCNEFPNIPVYDEQVEQALNQPSFFVRSIAPPAALIFESALSANGNDRSNLLSPG